MPPTPLAWKSVIKHLANCQLCPEMQGPPVVGRGGTVGPSLKPGKSILLVGQAPGPKEKDAGHPFVWTAGKTLFKWMGRVGVEEAAFRQGAYMAAVARCFPGKAAKGQGDRKPNRHEIAHCHTHLDAELTLLKPALIVPVGRMAIEKLVEFNVLDDVVGFLRPVEVPLANGEILKTEMVALPHPSGLSRYIQGEHGKQRITQALELLAAHPAWRQAFPQSHPPTGGEAG